MPAAALQRRTGGPESRWESATIRSLSAPGGNKIGGSEVIAARALERRGDRLVAGAALQSNHVPAAAVSIPAFFGSPRRCRGFKAFRRTV